MSSEIINFQHQLDQALVAIDKVLDIPNAPISRTPGPFLGDFAGESQTLLQRCDDICKEHSNVKPTIRIIHHFACSGGSLISKCISSMPNVFLLSEVHPHSELFLSSEESRYLPADISSLSKYSGIPAQVELAKKIFVQSTKITHEHVSKRGGSLVLREHTHSDFCIDLCNSESGALVNAISDDFIVLSIITLRDPVDSFVSLVKKGWVHFTPPTFDEYCRRLLEFIKAYPDSLIVLYENFVSKPTEAMQVICQTFEFKYNDLFESIFDSFRMTGDSGRSGAVISSRKREPLSTEFAHEVHTSLGYNDFITYLENRLSLPLNRTNYVRQDQFKNKKYNKDQKNNIHLY